MFICALYILQNQSNATTICVLYVDVLKIFPYVTNSLRRHDFQWLLKQNDIRQTFSSICHVRTL